MAPDGSTPDGGSGEVNARSARASRTLLVGAVMLAWGTMAWSAAIAPGEASAATCGGAARPTASPLAIDFFMTAEVSEALGEDRPQAAIVRVAKPASQSGR